MKKIYLLFLFVILVSCFEDETDAIKNPSTVIDMTKVGENYDEMVSLISSNRDLVFNLGDLSIELSDLSPSEGISLSDGLILESSDGLNVVMIDNQTESFYVSKVESLLDKVTQMYGFKDSENRNVLRQELFGRDNPNDNSELPSFFSSFEETANSLSAVSPFPSLFSEESTIPETIKQNRSFCGVTQEDELQAKEVRNSNPAGKTFLDLIPAEDRIYNLIIHKKEQFTPIFKVCLGMMHALKSLNSVEGSNYYYSKRMYTRLNVSTLLAPASIFDINSLSCLANFAEYLESDNRFEANTPDVHIYYTNILGFDDAQGRACLSRGCNFNSISRGIIRGFRVGVSNKFEKVFVHEVGHTLDAIHSNEIYWDKSLGLFGFWNNSVMSTSIQEAGVDPNYFLYSLKYIFPKFLKFYDPINRENIKASLND